MSPLVATAVIVVGFASGILSGMFGVGGAVLTTPGIRALGATPIEAVGSTLPAILPGALSGAWHYSRERMVDWNVALLTGVLGSSFAVLGAELSDHVNAHYLMILTALLLLYTGVRNVRATVVSRSQRITAEVPASAPVSDAVDTTDVEEPDAFDGSRVKQSKLAVGGVGAVAGFLAGLLGVGGGILLLPGYTLVLGMPAKRAVGTSLVAVAIFSIPAMITHALLGHINWAYALLLVVGVVPGAQLGARFTIKGSDARLRLLMGVFFTVIAIVYGGAEIAAL